VLAGKTLREARGWVVYYTSRESTELDAETLLSYLSAKLPEYMVPAA